MLDSGDKFSPERRGHIKVLRFAPPDPDDDKFSSLPAEHAIGTSIENRNGTFGLNLKR